MTTETPIVCGGGWIKRQTVCKTHAGLFAYLSIGWFIFSTGATLVLWDGLTLSLSKGQLEWTFAGMLVPEVIFIALAILFFLTETPRATIEYRPNPNFDSRNLY